MQMLLLSIAYVSAFLSVAFTQIHCFSHLFFYRIAHVSIVAIISIEQTQFWILKKKL